MDLANQTHERIVKVTAKKAVKAGEKMILTRTRGEYRFEDRGDCICIHGHRPTGELTSVVVRI